jgi:hypothetical protein
MILKNFDDAKVEKPSKLAIPPLGEVMQNRDTLFMTLHLVEPYSAIFQI